jgi:rsbT co-antagonist protein RsbR
MVKQMPLYVRETLGGMKGGLSGYQVAGNNRWPNRRLGTTHIIEIYVTLLLLCTSFGIEGDSISDYNSLGRHCLPNQRFVIPQCSHDHVILVILRGRMLDKDNTNPQILQELAELRQQIADLEAIKIEHKRMEAVLAEERNLLRTLIDHVPGYIYVKDRQGCFVMANQATIRLLGATSLDQVIGKTDFDFFPAEHAAQYYAGEQEIMRTEQALTDHEEPVIDRATDTKRWNLSTKVPLRDSEGRVVGLAGMNWDITERKLAEELLRASVVQAEVIQAQAAMLKDLSTPLIPISDHLMVMPLIGPMDSQRMHQVMDTLLTGISKSSVRSVILDITGVPLVDSQVANSLLRAAQGVQLLGTQLVLTGIRPEVAQTMVGLGIDLTNIVTHSTLQAGIAHAVAQYESGLRVR